MQVLAPLKSPCQPTEIPIRRGFASSLVVAASRLPRSVVYIIFNIFTVYTLGVLVSQLAGVALGRHGASDEV